MHGFVATKLFMLGPMRKTGLAPSIKWLSTGVIAGLIVVAVFGSIALTSLKQELIPSVSFPQLVVVTAYPGAAPDGSQDITIHCGSESQGKLTVSHIGLGREQ